MIEVSTIANTPDGKYLYKSYCLHEKDTSKVMSNLFYKQVKKEDGTVTEYSKGVLKLDYFMKTYIENGSLQNNCYVIQAKLVKYNKDLLVSDPNPIKLK